MDKKFIPIPGEIGNSCKDKNLGTTGAATNIDTEEPPGPSNGSGRWQRKGRRQRTERLLSPQSRRDWGRTGISKAEQGGRSWWGIEGTEDEESRNQDIRAISEEARSQMKDENPVLCGITVLIKAAPTGSRVEKAATMADAL